jgi:hypothetical protein
MLLILQVLEACQLLILLHLKLLAHCVQYLLLPCFYACIYDTSSFNKLLLRELIILLVRVEVLHQVFMVVIIILRVQVQIIYDVLIAIVGAPVLLCTLDWWCLREGCLREEWMDA